MIASEVLLYEDSAGRLFLHDTPSDTVFEIDPFLNPEPTFEEAAQAIVNDETQNWSPEWVHSYASVRTLLHHSETTLVACWHSDKPVEILHRPGRAAQKFLREEG